MKARIKALQINPFMKVPHTKSSPLKGNERRNMHQMLALMSLQG